MTVFGNQDIWFLCHLWCVSPPDCPVTSGNQTILCWKIPRVVPWISYFNAHSKGISHVWSADTGRSWEEVTPVAHWAARYEHAAQARAPGDEHCKVVFQWAKSQPQNSNNSLGFMILVTGWWFGTCCPYIEEFNHPNWFSYFSEGLKPPTSSCLYTKSNNVCCCRFELILIAIALMNIIPTWECSCFWNLNLLFITTKYRMVSPSYKLVYNPY